MRGVTETNDQQWKTRQFMQAAGVVFNAIHDSDLRAWALRYCIWLRDCYINKVTLPLPKYVGHAEPTGEWLAAYRKQFDALAERYLL